MLTPLVSGYRRSLPLILLSLIAALLTPQQVAAVPAFARQLNEECSTCHFQHFPKLTAFGRSFKASGFSMNADELLQSEGLSISPNLNATVFIRSKYSDVSGQRGVWEIPQEAAILAGGRLAEGIGGITEWSGGLLSGKMSFTTNKGYARLGTTLFTTDGRSRLWVRGHEYRHRAESPPL